MDDQPKPPIPPEVLALQKRKLQEAKDLAIEDRDGALQLIVEALKLNADHAEALWMYINLVPEPERKLSALRRLLRLEPNHQKAYALLKRLESTKKPISASQRPTPRVIAAAPTRSIVMKQREQHSPVEEQNELLRQMLAQQNQLMRQPTVVNIHNNTAASINQGGTAPLVYEQRNQTAFVVGFLAAVFLSTFGVSHLLNGKVGDGIIWMLLGWFIWLPIVAFVLSITTGLGTCLILPLHVAFALNNAEAGARINR